MSTTKLYRKGVIGNLAGCADAYTRQRPNSLVLYFRLQT